MNGHGHGYQGEGLPGCSWLAACPGAAELSEGLAAEESEGPREPPPGLCLASAGLPLASAAPPPASLCRRS